MDLEMVRLRATVVFSLVSEAGVRACVVEP